MTLILEADVARRIELTVHSDLHAVGLLARVTQALATAGFPCNVVSAVWHGHLYVPEAMAHRVRATTWRSCLSIAPLRRPG